MASVLQNAESMQMLFLLNGFSLCALFDAANVLNLLPLLSAWFVRACVRACSRIAHCVLMTSPCSLWAPDLDVTRGVGLILQIKPFSFSPTRIIKPHLYIHFKSPLFCLIYDTVLKIRCIYGDPGSYTSSFSPLRCLLW